MWPVARYVVRRTRPWLVPAYALILAIAAATPAYAWGKKGHRVAGALADSRLTPIARAAVAELLAGDASLTERTLAGISNWADGAGLEARRESRPWHYVNVAISSTRYRDEDCDEARGCVISKIGEFRKVLRDPSATLARRREALLYFVHFVQDVHQPFHVADDHDRGGSLLQVRFVGLDSGTNLHKVWDVDLIEYAGLSESSWVCRLDALADDPKNRGWVGGTPIDWANESLALGREAHLLSSRGRKIESGNQLDDAYANASLVVVQQRLAQAGVRLAHELNEIFK
jgi:nuclease S1